LRDRTKETTVAYLKPPAVTRKLFNPLAMRLGLSGSATLAIPGRASGVTRQVPIIDAYRAKAGRMVDTYWKRLPDPADHPTFRLEPPATG
jgi:hypothetical protein